MTDTTAGQQPSPPVYTVHDAESAGVACHHCGERTRITRVSIETGEVMWLHRRLTALGTILAEITVDRDALRAERDQLKVDLELTRGERNRVGNEIRREWMAKCAEALKERDAARALAARATGETP